MQPQHFQSRPSPCNRLKLLGLCLSLPVLLIQAETARALTPPAPNQAVGEMAQGIDEPAPEADPDPSDTLETDPTATEDPETTTPDAETAGESRFTCEVAGGQYTVMYHPQSQPGQSYPWAVPSALGGGWSAERRCNEISRRLESYRPDGLLELRAGVENSYNVICVTTQQNPDCRIVLTVPPGEDPKLTRDRVFENLTVADSGQSTQGVNTFLDGEDARFLERIFGIEGSGTRGRRPSRMRSDSIYLWPFLDRADGGTGTRLRGGMGGRSNPRLNPNNFR